MAARNPKNKNNISKEISKYGIEVVNFNIENINIPKEELEKIQEVFVKTFEARELSKVELGKSYAAIKSFEILGDAANNESDGGVGAMMSAGIGLGAGLPVGQQMGQKMSVEGGDNLQNSNPSLKDKLKELKSLLDEGLITEDQYKEKQSKYLEDF